MSSRLDRFSAILDRLLTNTPVRRDLAIEIGCGDGSALPILKRHFTHVIGLDLKSAPYRDSCWIVQADATYLPFFDSLRADLILIRHPDVHRHPTKWERIITTLPNDLQPNGAILITTYTLDEMRLVQGWIDSHLTPLTLSTDNLPPAGIDNADQYLLSILSPCLPYSITPDD